MLMVRRSSLNQHHAAIIPIARQALIGLGHTTTTAFGIETPITKEETDKIIKHFCGRIADELGDLVMHDEKLPDRPIIQKRDMSKLQASQLISNAVKWCNKVLKTNLPENE